MKNFALMGAAGYVAPRHLRAIKDNDCQLIAAFDKFDSVGVLDSYFPDTAFFIEFERFDRHIEKMRLERNIALDYVSICTPNYLHDAHIRMALRRESDAICEKPLVLNPWNIDALEEIQAATGRKIWNILQLREHPSIKQLREKINSGPADKIHDVDLTYITSRGNWYYTSWKGEEAKSGGIATNIGVHFFDMLYWVFGPVKQNRVHVHTHDRAAGYLEFEKARVRWFLSINSDLLPEKAKEKGMRTYRSITIGDEELEFSAGFTDLHTVSYSKILAGEGYGIEETRPAIELVYGVRNQKPEGLRGEYHPMAKAELTSHPFTPSR